jgi:hypothetical protein
VPTYLIVFFCISIALMLFGYLMDRAAVEGEIKGANGLPIFLMTNLSIGVWAIAAIVSIFLSGWGMFFLIIILTKPFNIGLLRFLVWRLETVGRRKTTIRAELKREIRDQFKPK